MQSNWGDFSNHQVVWREENKRREAQHQTRTPRRRNWNFLRRERKQPEVTTRPAPRRRVTLRPRADIQ